MIDWYSHFASTEGLMEPIDGAFLYAMAYVAMHESGRRQVVEVGTYRGRSACALGAACRDMGGKLYCFDNWKASSYVGQSVKEIAEKNIADAGLASIVTLETSDSADAGNKWNRGSVAMVFIDAGHAKEEVAKDIAAWWQRVPQGGILAFHDSTAPPVREAIEEWRKDAPCRHVGLSGCLSAYKRV